MIGYLRGEILDNNDGRLVVVAQGQGVGYAVTVPASPNYIEYLPGKAVELHIYTHVREDALELYGFSSKMEKDLFLTLLTVQGIGPKGAMGIISGVEASELLRLILDGDKAALTRIPGVGKKTAERVVLELADSVRKRVESGAWGAIAVAAGKKSGKSGAGATAAGAAVPAGMGSIFMDAKTALVGLGYREPDVASLLNRIVSESEKPIAKAEDLILVALRQLS